MTASTPILTALTRAEQALSDWTLTSALDHSGDDQIAAARARICAVGGPLAYINEALAALHLVRSALAPTP